MKSRVQKNQELHQSLATNTESDLESSSLSHFADRLNQIDDQFKKMDTSAHQNHEPQRARVLEETNENGTVQEPASFDTFENTYLKDFLDEVKEYNVKRGFDSEDQESNTLDEKAMRNVDSEAIQSVLDEINQSEIEEELPFLNEKTSTHDFLEETRIFNIDSLSNVNDDVIVDEPIQSESLSISEAVKEMVAEEEEVFEEEIEDITFTDEVFEPEMDIFESDALLDTDFSFDDEKFKRQLLEQTQTLQHKIIDQERNIDEMNETMVRTNRMLNVVLSLLLLAVVVVLILIFSYYI